MRQELRHFTIDGAYGWNQDWFPDIFMRMGGCAAVTACDSCVYFALRMGYQNMIKFNPEQITRADYLDLSRHMKRVLGPRMRGVDRLEIYQEGFTQYLRDVNQTGLSVGAFHGSQSYQAARDRVVSQINAGYPIPFLLLRHGKPEFDFYTWHWFLLMGYDDNHDLNPGAGFRVQAVTYGSPRWLDFDRLWDTGFDEKGGMIIFSA